MLDLGDLRPPPTAIAVSSEVGLDAKDHRVFPQGLVVWTGSVFVVVLVLVTIFSVAFRRRRHCPIPMSKDFE